MQIQALFEDIAEQIDNELCQAKQSIYIAVAWLTNRFLFETLVNKATNGVMVQLLIFNNEINRTSGIDFSQLNQGNSITYLIDNNHKDLIYNNFCVVDGRVVINGSYNWTHYDNNNVTIIYDDFQLADQFIAQFKQIRDIHISFQENIEFPIAKLIKHLEILKNYVILENEEGIERERRKLELYQFQRDIQQIITALKQNAFGQAVSLIEEFIRKQHQVVVYNDVELAALKLEIRHLEHQLNAYDNEKVELEKTLSLFHHRHTQELGKYISSLLHLHKLKLRDDYFYLDFGYYSPAFIEIERDEHKYLQMLDDENQKEIHELNEKQKRELKLNYKKAGSLCYPDKVIEDMQEIATETFAHLKEAYEQNDLATVNQILAELEQGNFFKYRSDTISEKDKLKITIQRLKTKIQQLETEIFALKESEEYQTISEIEDWDNYFNKRKQLLIDEIERIEQNLEEEKAKKEVNRYTQESQFVEDEDLPF